MGLARYTCSRTVCPLVEARGSGMNVQVVWERAERVVPNWSQTNLPQLSGADEHLQCGVAASRVCPGGYP